MAFRLTHSAALAAAILLGGCSFVDESLFPSLTPDGSSGGASSQTAGQPAVTSAPLTAQSVTPGQPTGTFVGGKVIALRNDLTQLQSTLNSQNDRLQQVRTQTVQDSQRFHGTIAAIEARLQVGTTPGNPILVQQWNEAQSELDRINEDVLAMNRLTTDVASTSGMAAYLLESVRAARSLSGAVDEDHRQLRVLEDETSRTTVLIERLLTELSADAQRQQQYLSNERTDLNTLAVSIKNGQLYGSSLSGARLGAGAAPVSPFSAAPVATTERPLVVIRFDRPNVNYEDALYTAVKGALDRRPNAVFEVVAVAPAGGAPGVSSVGEAASIRNAQSVLRSLTQMGLPNDRVRTSQASSPSASNGEVQVFVR
ncbi:MAG TPA: hypothetical protein VM661_10620 [Candidatus Sulfotelmatobacter sp.]|jgi:hypothetical protein|nr:hypothetical protein [Candidatus Sulfotelmatobacter sp.]